MNDGRASGNVTALWAVRVSFGPTGMAALAVGAFAAWLALSVGGAGVTRVVDDTATAVAAGAATYCCFAAGVRGVGRDRAFWLLLGAASAAWTLGEAAWAIYDLALGGNVPIPSFADLGYLGAVPLAVAALLSHAAHRRGAVRLVRAALDGSILATALLFLSWTFALGPVWRQSDLSNAAGLVAIAYPFSDVVVLFLLVRVLLYLDGWQRRSIGLVLVGLLAMALSDSGYTYLSAARGYSTGNLIDTGWFAAYVALALGAWSARCTGEPAQREPAVHSPTLALLGPYLPLLVALGVVAARVHQGGPIDRASLLLAFALTGLVLIRQTLAAISPGRTPRTETLVDVHCAGVQR